MIIISEKSCNYCKNFTTAYESVNVPFALSEYHASDCPLPPMFMSWGVDVYFVCIYSLSVRTNVNTSISVLSFSHADPPNHGKSHNYTKDHQPEILQSVAVLANDVLSCTVLVRNLQCIINVDFILDGSHH